LFSRVFNQTDSTSNPLKFFLGLTSALKSDNKFNPIFSLALIWKLSIWMKARTIYFVNNWIYTTNHKRIAVNYFWFVIFAGIVGMALATIIRLEMAYPGVGILAGDSLQYLSVVTAHAVVMVFFMIMPLKFGAFGNFLLPTQLGVHDVAFPRLNSAAFWFLPAGLIMLCQLVCLDRRYQRMNCYNIREIQSILRNRHFVDLVNTVDHRDFLNTVMVALRFKTNAEDITKPDMLLFFQLGTLNVNVNGRQQSWLYTTENDIGSFSFFSYEAILYKTVSFMDNLITYTLNRYYWDATPLFGNILNSKGVEFTTNWLLSVMEVSILLLRDSACLTIDLITQGLQGVDKPYLLTQRIGVGGGLNSNFGLDSLLVQTVWSLLTSFVSTPFSYSANALNNSVLGDFFSIPHLISNLLSFNDLVSFFSKKVLESNTLVSTTFSSISKYELNSSSKTTNSLDLQDKIMYANEEISSNFRQQRFQNPVFRYNYKIGNYFPKVDKVTYPHLFTTISELTGGIRKSAWFFSDTFSELFETSFNTYLNFIFDHNVVTDKEIGFVPSYVNNTDGFYNFFLVLSENYTFINRRWLSVNAIDQKFYKMFATSSMQQRIYGNWRQLKFTREAWRCRLLSARHQKTLYRRYPSEEGLFWSVERNAKDVLPGWAMITPFAARTRFTAIGKVDIGLMGVFLVLNSSIVSSANFLVTYRYLSTLNNRKMRDARSFFTEGVMVASWMMIAANPMLAIGILMLLSDRHWQTSFFDYSGGGDTVLFQHMFWFFGHPEVYVIMIPAFGFNNTLLSFYLRKRVSARASLMYSMYTIAFLGFFVWGHHMYMVGLAHTTRMLFSTLTVMISVPAATKLMHWCVTLVNSSFWVEVPFLFSLLFIFFFVSGGISGMAVAHTGMDILFHDSFYVIGHFHVMFAGAAMFASFGAFYFYFPSIFGVKFSRIWGYLHIVYFLLGQLMTVIPMFWLGYSGMPRRVLDYPASLGGWHAIVSAGHLLSVAGLMAFFIMIFDSLRQGRAATRNTFGISRFNTRFNFYLYEVARNRFVQRKGWYISRYNRPNTLSLNELNYNNNEALETTLYSYVLVKV
jgi:heme/copper-type cytochrome/quinol oxidase subunit 1